MNETIADIVADLREHSGETTPSLVCFTEDGGIDFSALAARIEAASKRERSNAAAMRKALKYARDVLAFTCRIDWRTTMAWGELHDAIHKADVVLASPPRNCDKYGADGAAVACSKALGIDWSHIILVRKVIGWLFSTEEGAK